MCGRFSMAIDSDNLQTALALGQMPADWKRRYNIAPSQDIAAVRDAETRAVEMLQWGLVPFWAKDPAIGNSLINARSESVHEKPSFKNAFRKRRCLILADGFYEWQKSDKGSRPFYFSLRAGEPFAFAGLWENWQPKDQPAAALTTCAIITTAANETVSPVHERMPVILRGEAMWDWLLESGETALLSLLRPAPADWLRAWEVSRAVNNPRQDGPECAEPVQSTPA
ncbi:MAG: SOS response-associated peptidase [Anaerolineaceae bacterium]|nr:SOS response-associated peptidase [Anaerolineaceae bacterium]HOG77994.1 SOS response-associated peptidase [Anaerolineaceae bacterium]